MIGISLICILITVGATYAVVIIVKNEELRTMKTQYTGEIDKLNTEIVHSNTNVSHASKVIENLTGQVKNLSFTVDRYKLIGTWKNTDSGPYNFTFPESLTFYPSGKCYDSFFYFLGYPPRWGINNSKLSIEHNTPPDVDFPYTVSYNYSFSENATTIILTLTESTKGTVSVYTKQ
jgi:hypothetical protein